MKSLLKSQHLSQPIKNHSSDESTGTTFSDHVVELRNRGMWLGLVFIIFSALAYTYHEILLKIIMAPLDGEKLIYLTPGGGFSFIFLVSMYTGLLATVPLFIYHLHAFIKPALPERARRSAVRILLSATVLLMGGIAYGYFVAIPGALRFLTTFAGDAVSPNLTADSYLNFFLAYVAGLSLLSLLPLLLMFVHWIKPLKPGGLLKSERWVILFAFIAAALITPTPDVVNQAMIALPVIGIYQLGVVAVLIATLQERRRKKILLRNQAIARAAEAQPEPYVTPIIKQPYAATKPVLQPAVISYAPTVNAQQKLPRTVRSIDGMRPQQHIRVAPRSSQISPQMRPMSQPTRNIDGIILRPSRIVQN